MHAELPGIRIWYEDSGGAGVPVLLLHAGTGCTPMWRHQVPVLKAAGFRVIAYDRIGYGRSTDGDSVPSQDLALVLEKLGIEKTHLVGTAAGGIVALDYALSHPERLKSLVVANSIGGVQDEDYLELQRRLRPKPTFDALPPEVRELGPAYRAANPEGVREWIELEHQGKHAGTVSMPKTRNRITFSLLETLKVPTLLLTGDADLYTPPPVLDMFKKRIKTSEAMVIQGCGHSCFWEAPERFNKAVLEFIARK
jgi:pimeloyl-ACP methyl ester carboxylesterase